ncbi:MAG: hypothetical protein KJO85_11145, partial [Gammaproteobacteria bacterium]|nr:hypothetical protein [Gammaproteobacteria bacterium]
MQHAQRFSEQGIPVAVAIGPSEIQVNDGLRNEVLALQSRQQDEFDMQLPQRIISQLHAQHAPDVTLFDMTAGFRAHAQATGSSLFFRRNTHWDKEGNRLAAELIGREIRSAWFGQPGNDPATGPHQALPSNPLLSDQQIRQYLAPLNRFHGGGFKVTGAVRPIHLLDGISDQPDNWAIAPLGSAVSISFAEPMALAAVRIHLFDGDGRHYRYSLEAELGDGWELVAGVPETSSEGAQEWTLNGRPVSAIRITGIESTAAAGSPTAGYLLIHEIEWTQKQAESGY